MYQDHLVIEYAKWDHTDNKYSFFKVSCSVWILGELGDVVLEEQRALGSHQLLF